MERNFKNSKLSFKMVSEGSQLPPIKIGGLQLTSLTA